MKVIKSCISKRIKNPFLNSYFADAKCYTPYSRLKCAKNKILDFLHKTLYDLCKKTSKKKLYSNFGEGE